MPRLKPPFFPAAKGLYLQPTIVNNVETLSNLPWIIANGGSAFAALGAETSRGTRMFAVSGHVKNPGVFEVEFGVTTFRDLLYRPTFAGGMRAGHELKAFIPGGASAPWFFPEHLDLPLEAGAVGKAGSMLGSGAIVVMDDTTDMVKAAPADRAVLRPRVVRQVHAVPRGHELAGEDPRSASSTATAGPSDLDLLLDVCDNISPSISLAAEADDDLPARAVGGVADRVRGDALPRRVRGQDRRPGPGHHHGQRRGLHRRSRAGAGS